MTTTATHLGRPKHHFLNPEKPPTVPIIQIPAEAFVTAEIATDAESFQMHFYMPGGEVIRFNERRTDRPNEIIELELHPTRFSITCTPYRYSNTVDPYSWENVNYGKLHSAYYIKGMTKAYTYYKNCLFTTKEDLPTLNAYSTFKLCLGSGTHSAATTFAAFYDLWRRGTFNGDTLSDTAYEALDPSREMAENTRETVLTPHSGFCDGLLTVCRRLHQSAWDILVASGVKPTKPDFIFLPVKKITFNGAQAYATPVLPAVQRSWLIMTRINGVDNVPINFLTTQLTREQLASHL